jgi:hypothetical protein
VWSPESGSSAFLRGMRRKSGRCGGVRRVWHRERTGPGFLRPLRRSAPAKRRSGSGFANRHARPQGALDESTH